MSEATQNAESGMRLVSANNVAVLKRSQELLREIVYGTDRDLTRLLRMARVHLEGAARAEKAETLKS